MTCTRIVEALGWYNIKRRKNENKSQVSKGTRDGVGDFEVKASSSVLERGGGGGSARRGNISCVVFAAALR